MIRIKHLALSAVIVLFELTVIQAQQLAPEDKSQIDTFQLSLDNCITHQTFMDATELYKKSLISKNYYLQVFAMYYMGAATIFDRQIETDDSAKKYLPQVLTLIKQNKFKLDTIALMSNCYMAWLSSTDAATKLIYAKEAMRLADKINSDYYRSKSYRFAGMAYRFLRNIEMVKYYAHKELDAAVKSKDYLLIGNGWYSLAQADENQNPDSIVVAYENALANYKKANFTKGINVILQNLASAYNAAGKKQMALETNLEFSKFVESSGDSEQIQLANLNLASTYFLLRDTISALTYAQKTLKYFNGQGFGFVAYNYLVETKLAKGEYDSAIYYINKYLEVPRKESMPSFTSGGYCKMASAYIHLNKPLLANTYCDSAAMTFNFLKSISPESYPENEVEIFLVRSRVSAMLHQKEKVSRYIDSCLMQLPLAKNIYLDKKALKELSESCMMIGDSIRALRLLLEFNVAAEKFDAQEKAELSANMLAKYGSEKKEAEIAKLNAEKKQQQTEAENQKLQRNFLLAGVVMLILITGIIIFVFVRTKNLNKQLALAKNRAEQSERYKQMFLANMSHEIRTPMNAVMGMSALLANTSLNEKQKQYVSGIKNSSENLLVVINDILDLSKVEAGKMVFEKINFDLHYQVEHVYKIMKIKADEKRLSFEYEIDKDVPQYVIGDPSRLVQVLINLTGNAIKFTSNGTVHLHIKKQANELITFSIKDSGIGIAADKINSIFESFNQAENSTTRRFGGTGLGLSISKQLVELQGGTISVNSKEGKGSEFLFILPFATGSAQSEVMHSQDIVQNIHPEFTGLILLAEDNHYNQIVAVDTIKQFFPNVTVEVFNNGKELIDFLKESNTQTDNGIKVQTILMDAHMPLMDGIETTRYIRTHFDAPLNSVPIIALTASVIQSEIENCFKAGMNDFIPKPFKPVQLMQAILKATENEAATSLPNPLTPNLLTPNLLTPNPLTPVLHNKLNEFTSGDEALNKKYTLLFLETVPEKLKLMEHALSTNDWNKLQYETHTLKPTLEMFGLTDAVAGSIRIEKNCLQNKNATEARTDFDTILNACEQAINALNT